MMRRRSKGQALVEFALILPFLFLLIVNVVNFGGMFYAWITVANAARAGAQYLVMGSSSVYSPSYPSTSQVTTLVKNDLSSLPNRASAVVSVCTNNNGIAWSGTSLCATTDPEAGLYVLGGVDVTYTYLPFIPLWSFSKLGIVATLPPTTIHRQAVMRME